MHRKAPNSLYLVKRKAPNKIEIIPKAFKKFGLSLKINVLAMNPVIAVRPAPRYQAMRNEGAF